MDRIAFNPAEITEKGYNAPVTAYENMKAVIDGKNPVYMPMSHECANFTPRIDPDNVARGFVFDGEAPLTLEEKGGKDMFGLEWVFVPVTGGSIVHPEHEQSLKDVNDWKDVIQFPDVTKWDWEGAAEKNKEYLASHAITSMTFLNGFMFERLISFMGFENAAMALIDEDQVDAVIELTDAMCEKVYIPYLECVRKYFPSIQMICLHDDWGTQLSTFFSLETAREVYVPLLKKFTDKCKELGFIMQLHSCGKNEKNVPAYIEGGVQCWNGMYMNDKRALYEKYGNDFVFIIDGPHLADEKGHVAVTMPYVSQKMDASKEEMYAAAKEVCEYYIRDGKCHVIANTMRCNPYYIEGLYYYSRQMLNK